MSLENSEVAGQSVKTGYALSTEFTGCLAGTGCPIAFERRSDCECRVCELDGFSSMAKFVESSSRT